MSMKADSFSLSWISDPQVFAVNRLDAVSDHDVYASAQEAEQGVSSLKRSLRGAWRMRYAECPTQAPAEYWREGFDDHDFDWVQAWPPSNAGIWHHSVCEHPVPLGWQ